MTDGLAWLLDPNHWQGPDGVPVRIFEHLAISIPSVLTAAAIALPAGIAIGHSGRGATLAVNLANIGRAVPSYAVMVIVLPISIRWNPDLGLDVVPTVTAMILLAIPPILVNTYAGIRSVEPDAVEAARAMGMRERDIVARVELPLALPVIVGGFRTATVQVIATATLGAIVAYGGLGRYLIDGIARNEDGRLFAGVILVAALALGAEAGLALAQRAITPAGVRRAVGAERGGGAPRGPDARRTAGERGPDL
ncbi:MAG TPA: ABC transporter permease [Candidatus Binatia bacterium]|nr:ABC transporter permease [Candidatus Binatia bacterium]